jgi:transcriptional regulator with XRE-family HTH domain
MIKNERQYRITKSAAEKFERALASFDAAPPPPEIHPLLRKAERDALVGQLEELRDQLAEYESLRRGKQPVVALNSLAELPRQLVRARIAAGLSHKELAALLDMKEQQIQRYEANDYEGASLSRLQEVCDALNVNVQENVFMPTAGSAARTLYKRMKDIGLEKDFVTSRLVPPGVAAKARSNPAVYEDHLVFHAATAASHIYGWAPTALLGPEDLLFDARAAGSARFKLRSNTDEKKLTAYTIYAHYLANLVLKATEHLPVRSLPTDAAEVRAAILGVYGRVDLASTLAYAWDLGVPVLPLNDSGAFYGALWRVAGRNVIVLKQRTNFPARWLDDLLHEFRHAGEEPGMLSRTVLEASETSEERRNSDEEVEASLFASDVVLDGRAEQIVRRCIDATRGAGGGSGRLEILKSVVPAVAREEGVPADSLANYLAYRLSGQKMNWWGAASNLQRTDENPWETARDVLLTRVHFSRLAVVDRDLLTRALSGPEANEA